MENILLSQQANTSKVIFLSTIFAIGLLVFSFVFFLKEINNKEVAMDRYLSPFVIYVNNSNYYSALNKSK
jgi:hypothetical protein